MIAVITGDIIDSRTLTSPWLEELKLILAGIGNHPHDWELYRGDQFQVAVTAENGLAVAMQLKAAMKKIGADVRISIGIGNEEKKGAAKISERNGQAFIRSGESFETLKKFRVTMAINTGNALLDKELNLMLRLALSIMDRWLPQPAAVFLESAGNPNLSQEALGNRLGVNQAAISRRRKRAHVDLLLEFEAHFREKIINLSS